MNLTDYPCENCKKQTQDMYSWKEKFVCEECLKILSKEQVEKKAKKCGTCSEWKRIGTTKFGKSNCFVGEVRLFHESDIYINCNRKCDTEGKK